MRIAQGQDNHDVSPTCGVLVDSEAVRIEVDVPVEVLEDGGDGI